MEGKLMEGKLMRACSNSRERRKPKPELKPKLKEEKLEQLMLVQMAMPSRISEFYVLDLETEKITKKPVATLVNQGYDYGSTVYLGSMIYCVGGHDKEDMITTLPKFIAEAGDHHLHSHISRAKLIVPCDRLLRTTDPPGPDDVDPNAHAANAVARKGGLVLEPTRFEAGPKMLHPLFLPPCAVLDGKIYAFASCKFPGEVFEPEGEGGEWKAFPPIPSSIIVTDRDLPSHRYLYVSNPVIPDHKNHRIIVHVDPINHLFAYYPQLGTWECLDHEFMSEWYPATALVDEVLYIHTDKTPQNSISAYDLSTKAWLNVSYYDDKYLYHHRFCYAERATMLLLGNNVLCLANSCTYPTNQLSRSDLSFIRFKVQRTSPQEVLVTLIDSKCFTLDGYYKAKHFILL